VTYAIVFPGQGSQRVGMLDALRSYDGMERLLDAAEALSGMALGTIAEEGPDAELADTRVAQPLLYLADWAWGQALQEAGASAAAVAGHSLGEFAALTYAGVFSVEAGLELVIERSRLMAAAAASTPGGMAAVLGLDDAVVRDCVDSLAGVWVANDNAPGQIVISGTHVGLEKATEALTGCGARRVIQLKVAGAFHSPLMQAAAESFATDVLSQTAFSDARVPVVSNAEPAPAVDADILRHRLAMQMIAPVRWNESMGALAELEVTTLIEAGPGSVLTGLARRVEGLSAVAVEERGVDAAIEEVAQP
jgi:[acyl-carrier-protein] S-malonyltransferase